MAPCSAIRWSSVAGSASNLAAWLSTRRSRGPWRPCSMARWISAREGSLAIGAGGLAIGTLVLSGGVERIGSGGVASGTTVSSGGSVGIASGGVAIGTTVSAGGMAGITAGSVISGLTILSGGTVLLGLSPGTSLTSYTVTLSGYSVNPGVTLHVLGWGTAVDTTVSSGGE